MKINFFKIVLSCFIIFHIISVFVLPNPESIVYRNLTLIPQYGNLFGLNTTWRFFSPNPLIRLLEYDVFYRDKDGQLQMTSHQYPSMADHELREIYNRKMTNGMFMLSRGEYFDKI